MEKLNYSCTQEQGPFLVGAPYCVKKHADYRVVETFQTANPGNGTFISHTLITYYLKKGEKSKRVYDRVGPDETISMGTY